MEQLSMESKGLRPWPVRVTQTEVRGSWVLLQVRSDVEANIALEAAEAGIAAYNRDPAWLDPAVNKEGPSPKGNATSKLAALRNWPRSGTQRNRILEMVLANHAGMTRDEIHAKSGLVWQTVGPRVLELVQGGWLVETPQRRKTRRGDDSIVLVPSQKAIDYERSGG